jgi:hypothetical protein
MTNMFAQYIAASDRIVKSKAPKAVLAVRLLMIGLLLPAMLGISTMSACQNQNNVDPLLNVAPLAVANDMGITMSIKGARAGYNRIVININFSWPDNREVLEYNSLVQHGDFSLVLEDGETLYPSDPQNGGVVYAGVLYKGIAKNRDGSYSENFEIDYTVKYTQKVNLSICKILNVDGTWNAEFELPYEQPVIYKIDKVFDVYDGIVQVHSIITDSLSSTVEYTTNLDSPSSYPIWFFSSTDKAYTARNHFTVTNNSLKQEVLPDGSIAYQFIYLPYAEHAVIDMEVRYVRGEIGSLPAPCVYSISLADFK